MLLISDLVLPSSYIIMFSNSAIHSDPFCSIFCNSKPHNALPKNWPKQWLGSLFRWTKSLGSEGSHILVLRGTDFLDLQLMILVYFDQANLSPPYYFWQDTHPFQPHQRPGAMAQTSETFTENGGFHQLLMAIRGKINGKTSYPVAKGLRAFCSRNQCFLQLFLGKEHCVTTLTTAV